MVMVPERYTPWYNYQVFEKEMHTPGAASGFYVLSDKHKIILNFIHIQLSNLGDTMGIVSYRDIYDLQLLRTRHGRPVEGIDPGFHKSAEAYFSMADHLLHYQGKTNYHSNPKRNLYCLFILVSKNFCYIYRISRKLTIRIVATIQTFHGILASSGTRKSVSDRLSHPHWYKAHLQSWGSVFTHYIR